MLMLFGGGVGGGVGGQVGEDYFLENGCPANSPDTTITICAVIVWTNDTKLL